MLATRPELHFWAETGELQVEEQKRSREGQRWEGKERDNFEQKVAARSVVHPCLPATCAHLMQKLEGILRI